MKYPHNIESLKRFGDYRIGTSADGHEYRITGDSRNGYMAILIDGREGMPGIVHAATLTHMGALLDNLRVLL